MLGHVVKEVTKNLLKGAFPTVVTRLRRHTGRGRADESPADVLDHGRGVFEEFLHALSLRPEAVAGKRVVELGPGDTLVTGLLFLAHGAASYAAVDRFSFRLESPFNMEVYRLLRDRLDQRMRSRLDEAVELGPEGLRAQPSRLVTIRASAERFRLPMEADLIVSNAVLEHVRNLKAVAARISEALSPGGRTAHGVDLRHHDYYPDDPWRFLYWSPALWTAMHSFRGSPNRERLPRYLECFERAGLSPRIAQVTERRPIEEVRAVRPRLHEAFRSISDEDLAVMVFWLVGGKLPR